MCVNSGSCGIVVVDCVMHGRELRVTTLERACTVGPEQLSPASAAGCLPCVLGERRRPSPPPGGTSLPCGSCVMLHGRCDGLRQGEVQRVRSPRHARGTQQVIVVDSGDSSESVGRRAVDEFGDATVVFAPARLERNGVLLEVVEHVRDCVEEEVLDTASR